MITLIIGYCVISVLYFIFSLVAFREETGSLHVKNIFGLMILFLTPFANLIAISSVTCVAFKIAYDISKEKNTHFYIWVNKIRYILDRVMNLVIFRKNDA